MKMSFPWWVAGCLVVVSCAGDGAYKLGGDMSDAGRVLLGDALVDGGEALQDAGMMARSDARADVPPGTRVFDVPCTTTNVRTRMYDPSNMRPYRHYERITEYFAEIRGPSVVAADIQELGVVTCGYEEFTGAPSACPPISECVGQLIGGEHQTCAQGLAEFRDGLIRVSCGVVYEIRIPSGETYTEGSRYRTARIVIR